MNRSHFINQVNAAYQIENWDMSKSDKSWFDFLNDNQLSEEYDNINLSPLLDWAYVYNLIEDITHAYLEIALSQRSKRVKTYVYLMYDQRTNFTKIGRSKNPNTRERTLQADNPLYEIIFKWESFNDVEKSMHIHFDSDRVRGEWFCLSDDQIEECKKLIKEKSK